MVRFFIGLLLGVILTAEALAIGGVGHGTYAPLVFTASLTVLIPILGLFTGPLLWAFYFLLIPNLERSWSQMAAFSLVLLAHFGPGFWVAYDDPAFARADAAGLLVFGFTVLATIGSLMLFCVRHRTARASHKNS
ncbi:MAG TPA: hypothetical protein VEM96_11795 [Pyrinomonadaceae bacterium]|nr:hypothetical protein [Pyrinomonadaceae bacterium]